MPNRNDELARMKRKKTLRGISQPIGEAFPGFPDGPVESVAVTSEEPQRRVHAIFTDEAERERELLRHFIENAPVAIAMFDCGMNYIAASRCWLRDYRLEGRNITGRSHYEIFPEITERWRVIHQRALAGEVLRSAEDRFERADGTVQWLRWELQPWFNGDNEVGGVIIFTEDITQRRRARDILQESEEKFRRIFSTVSDAILVFDADTRKFVDMNDAALKLYGYTREEMKNVTAMDLTAEPERSAESILQARTGSVTRVPLRYHKRKDGTVFPVEIFANTFLFAGRTLYCGVVRNITGRRKTEELLQKANRTLRAIRDCHKAILRAQTEPELLNEICRIIVQSGERMTWVGYADDNPRKTVSVKAAAGVSDEHLKNAHVTWADVPRGHGPVGTAIRTGRASLCRNTQTDPRYACWRESAKKNGFGSVIGLPLRIDKKCFGALAIYAPELDAFDEEEQDLLTDLANDLAFGITTLRLRDDWERLEREIFKSIEREQERIGRDLHDGLCQLLVGAKYRAVYLQKILAGENHGTRRKKGLMAREGTMWEEARSLEGTLGRAIEQARDIAHGLNPSKLTPAGLTDALEKLADDVKNTHRIHCFCHIPRPVEVSDDIAHHLFRIAQEAVQNAVKHAGAKNISISLTQVPGRVALTIKDDGVGISARLKKKGMGLNNMQARTRIVGGTFEVRRRKSGGTAICCELPLM